MIRWEYCILSIADGVASVRIFAVLDDDTEVRRIECGSYCFCYVAELGLDGWEMVAHNVRSSGEEFTFKRPVSFSLADGFGKQHNL